MGRVATRSQMTAEEYLAWERAQPTKHEFFHGEVFAMAGGSPRHNALCGRVIAFASRELPRCVVLTSDQRVTMASRGRYVYPDVSIVCGGVEIEAGDVLLNPTILVEVLSSSTEQYDRGLKWEGYQRIASLADYVLVSQAEPRIEHYRRAADGSWTYRAAGPGERVTLSTGAALIVDETFADVLDLPGD
jgi:Uma2 family endonuclease